MYKIKAVALDLTGNALEWLNAYGDEDHMELCEIITLDDNSPIPISDLPMYDNWDILLVFEDEVREKVEVLLGKLGISKDRVIYPMDMDVDDYSMASYLFKGPIRKLLKYHSYRKEGYRFAMSYAEGLTYVNTARDDIILPTMIFEQSNWAREDMEEFYRLSTEHFSFTSNQMLFCDIGANIGTTCIYFKKRIDKEVKILTFEPSAQNHRLIRVNALLNEIDENDCIFINKGVSDKTSTAGFNYKANNPGGSSVVSGDGSFSESVELITFDEFFEGSSYEPADIKYMWIDVEGFEARFLAGARNVLDQINVPILMEFIPEFYSGKDGEFELLMNELERNFGGYICMQHPDKGIMPIENLRREQNNMDIQWDLFLLKQPAS